jgi:D-beta-D-heptose 7-phosphate kinase/D-beta-D-heptose 1-phosphate adenosyltransferase
VTGRPLVVVGDAFLDRDLVGRAERLSPEAPVPVVDLDEGAERTRPGGAGLAALLAARDGRDVVVVTALGDDEAGAEVTRLLAEAGVAIVDLGLAGPTPEKARVLADGRLVIRLDRGDDGARPGPWTGEAGDALAAAGAVLVADYGRGLADGDDVREALGALPPRVPLVWDPHPQGPAPVRGARLATPNRREAANLVAEVDVGGEGLGADAVRARLLAERWGAAAVAVTRGAAGAVLWGGDGPPLAVPAPRAGGEGQAVPDACGAGDRFAATAAGALADGSLPSEAVTLAVAAASSYVAAGGAAGVARSSNGAARASRPRAPGAGHACVPPGGYTATGAEELARRVRAGGGTVVATGGCFDVVHAGHVRMLEAARALGDCLIVCLNSDDSVRRLKGPDRPLVPTADREAVLRGLGCVDAVAVFGEDTPEAVLERLRPHLFVKGADYRAEDLPEARALARWGGQAVVVPFLEGRSTSSLMASLARSGGHSQDS